MNITRNGGGVGGDFPNTLYCVGPLNLDISAKQANTVFNSELCLGGKEFDALDMLARQENEYLTFEHLYNAVWDEKDGLDRRGDARLGLENIVTQVSRAGGGFMWIAYTPEKGFS